MAAETPETPAAPAPKPKSKMMPLMMVGALMAVEGVGVFFLAKALSPPPAAATADDGEGGEDAAEEEDPESYAEVELADCRPSNMMSGRFITFQVRVSGLVLKEELERAEGMIRAKSARLEDGVNTVFRSAAPKHLSEPELQTIKRRLKNEFDQILGDDQLLKKVLIPLMLQSRPGV